MDEVSDNLEQGAQCPNEAARATLARCRQFAFSMLARREHCRFEMRQKLLAKTMPERLVDQVIEDLAARDLQSDARYCDMMVRSRSHRGVGPRRVYHELCGKGIDSEFVQQVLSVIDWQGVLLACWQKKFKARLPLGDWAEYARQQRFLLQRGFSPEAIAKLLSSAR